MFISKPKLTMTSTQNKVNIICPLPKFLPVFPGSQADSVFSADGAR
jgi:hypothetical protein